MQLLLDETLTKMKILSDSINITREFVNLSKTAGFLLPLYLSINALAAYQSASPLTAEMAEVSGVHYLHNTTAEENRLCWGFLWLTLPGKTVLTAHRKGERLLGQSSSWDGCRKVRKWDLGKARDVGRRKPHTAAIEANRNEQPCYRKVCPATHISGKRKHYPYVCLGQNACMRQPDSSWLSAGVLYYIQ